MPRWSRVRRFRRLLCLTIAFAFALSFSADSYAADWYARKTQWNGFDQFHFAVKGRKAYLIAPKQAAEGKPWVWRARFPGYHAEMDLMLVERGFHIGYVDVAGLYGAPKAVKIGDAFYSFLTGERGLSKRPAMEGVSRGGLFVYNWAAKNLDRVACIYCDTPVCDFKSWPAGKGEGVGSAGSWKQCLQAYQLNEEQALSFRGNPIDHAKKIADAKIPLLHIVSDNDQVVPPAENTDLLTQRLVEHGHKLEVIRVAKGTAKSKGHHFTHPEPERVVQFIVKHVHED